MAIKVQYNKTAIQQYQKQLSVRERALPILKSKETALRVEVKRIADQVAELKRKLDSLYQGMQAINKFWVEFPDLLRLQNTNIAVKNIAGVKIPILRDIEFTTVDYSLINQKAWIPLGLQKLKEILRVKIEIEVVGRQLEILSYARKKTTQKVNLYEKVQIPEFRDAIRKVKRYLEDKENLEKAAQKIVKERNVKQEVRP